MECEIIEDEQTLKTLVIPDGTRMEEHTIVIGGDVIVGNHSYVGYGLIANSVVLGERVNISGNIATTSDIRIDIWSCIDGNVSTDENAYLGEFVNIDGKLVVKGDLDVGNDVSIKGGFEARGWIVVRNPVPVIAYIFLYIAELLRLGKGEEVEKALDDLFSDEDEKPDIAIMIIPNGSRISADSIRVPGMAKIGSCCHLVGNVRAESLKMDDETTLYGSIRAAGTIELGGNNVIHGNIVSRGKVIIHKGTHVLGQINADLINIHESARVDGVMKAGAGISFIREEEENVVNDNELIKLDIPNTI